MTIQLTMKMSINNNDNMEEEEDGILKNALECLSLLAVACSSDDGDGNQSSYNICLEFLEWLPNLLVFLGHPQQELVVKALIAMS